MYYCKLYIYEKLYTRVHLEETEEHVYERRCPGAVCHRESGERGHRQPQYIDYTHLPYNVRGKKTGTKSFYFTNIYVA